MTATPADAPPRRLDAAAVDCVAQLLDCDFGRLPPGEGAVGNQFLLAALDRGEHERFIVWPGHDPDQGSSGDPQGLLYTAPTGTLVVAGVPAAGPALADAAERSGWRVLIGAAEICDSLLDAYPRGLFHRRPAAREQRFMVAVPEAVGHEPVEGFRRARVGDVDRLTELACRLHVEDQMGPPIPRSSRSAVRSRVLDIVSGGDAWVVERDGDIVAKVDLSLCSRRRGAQIAGVYVDGGSRGQGVGGGAVRTLARRLLDDGLPAVTLHVRADNVPAIRAYRRAGFVDCGAWRLALR